MPKTSPDEAAIAILETLERSQKIAAQTSAGVRLIAGKLTKVLADLELDPGSDAHAALTDSRDALELLEVHTLAHKLLLDRLLTKGD